MNVKELKARSHGAIFFFTTAMQKMDCLDVNECSYGAISCACDALVCSMLYMIRFHTHSV